MNAVFGRKVSGQSIPLIALMLVILFAFVGLSVDVGNTYAEQRTVVRATNAASVAAMDAVIKGYDDAGVAKIIRESLKSNGLNLMGDPGANAGAQPTGDRQVRAYYMDIDGKHISDCEVGACGRIPSDVNYIQVTVDGLVQTYFARVVGRPDLPVNNTSFAGRCPPTNGVYPLAINNADVDDKGFIAPTTNTHGVQLPQNLPQVYGTYKDAQYPTGVPWRRIYLKGTGSGMPGNFSFLRWSADTSKGSSQETARAFQDGGTLAEGYDEVVPWPNAAIAKPAGYPLAPHQISIGDYIHGDSGLSWSNGTDGLRTALITLMDNHTLLMLPMISDPTGSGNNSAFKMVRLGAFYIVDPFPNDANNGGVSKNGGANAYIDLIYVGTANETACLVTNVDPDNPNPPGTPGTGTPTPPIVSNKVVIPFSVKPRWGAEDKPSDPIAYQMVLDVSGSMSWDFKGNGTIGGTVKLNGDTTGGTNYHCEWSNPDTTYPYTDSCQGGPNSSWRKYQERRIYLTKQAVATFIDNLGPNDAMRFTAFSTGVGSGNTKVVPSSGFTNDTALLKSELLALGSYSSDPYRTSGGTPGPQALAQAKNVILAAPAKAPNGQSYRRVVVYLTDGVANVFMNGQTNYAQDICKNLSQSAAINTPDPCQIGVTAGGTLRPITAMIDQADQIKQADPSVQIYVVALAGVATDGLNKVASSSQMVYPANEPGYVATILDKIRKQASGATCLRQEGPFTATIPSTNHADLPAPWTLASDSYGKVTIYNENGSTVVATADIKHDEFSNRLDIKVDLPPGTYQMSAWIGYKGSDQPKAVSRVYSSLSTNAVTYSSRIPIVVNANGSLNDTVILPMVYVDLAENVNVCP